VNKSRPHGHLALGLWGGSGGALGYFAFAWQRSTAFIFLTEN
jgi:hypothetical protein